MSTTVERRPRLTRRTGPQATANGDDTTQQSAPMPVPTPPKPRRRWGLVAAAVLVVALGALGNVWLLQSSTDAVQVVAARTAIERGQVVTAEQLMSVSVSADPAVRTVRDMAFGFSGGRSLQIVGEGGAVRGGGAGSSSSTWVGRRGCESQIWSAGIGVVSGGRVG